MTPSRHPIGLIEQVVIQDDWARRRHVVVVIGRAHPGAPRSILTTDGSWVPLAEQANVDGVGEGIGYAFPEGVLDAIVAQAQGTTPPVPAVEAHLADALAVRDRLLDLVDRVIPAATP